LGWSLGSVEIAESTPSAGSFGIDAALGEDAMLPAEANRMAMTAYASRMALHFMGLVQNAFRPKSTLDFIRFRWISDWCPYSFPPHTGHALTRQYA
jgi:hypothetical protein